MEDMGRIEQMPFRERILRRVAARIDEKGFDQCSVMLAESGSLTARQRLEILAEELVDGLVYIEGLIDRVKDLERAAAEDVVRIIRRRFGGEADG